MSHAAAKWRRLAREVERANGAVIRGLAAELRRLARLAEDMSGGRLEHELQRAEGNDA